MILIDVKTSFMNWYGSQDNNFFQAMKWMLATFQAKKGGRVGRKGKLRPELHIRHTNHIFHHMHVSDKIINN